MLNDLYVYLFGGSRIDGDMCVYGMAASAVANIFLFYFCLM